MKISVPSEQDDKTLRIHTIGKLPPIYRLSEITVNVLLFNRLRLRKEEEQRLAEEARLKRVEEEKKLAEERKIKEEEEARLAEEERVRLAEEEAVRQAELQKEREEAEAKALEEAERVRQERDRIMQQNQQERMERKKVGIDWWRSKFDLLFGSCSVVNILCSSSSENWRDNEENKKRGPGWQGELKAIQPTSVIVSVVC